MLKGEPARTQGGSSGGRLMEAALKIDPATADVDWTYGNTLDPYGVRSRA
jgi:hypothetical protein